MKNRDFMVTEEMMIDTISNASEARALTEASVRANSPIQHVLSLIHKAAFEGKSELVIDSSHFWDNELITIRNRIRELGFAYDEDSLYFTISW